MGIKEFVLCLLNDKDDSDKEWIDKINDYNDTELGFYDSNWLTSFFWESVDCIKGKFRYYPLEYIDDVNFFTDLPHRMEERLLVVRKKSNSKLYALKYELYGDEKKLYNDCIFELVTPKEIVITKYSFN